MSNEACEWQEIGSIEGDFQLRFDTIGLSIDGHTCFAIHTGGENPHVYDVESARVIGRLTDPFDVPEGFLIPDAEDEGEDWDWRGWAEANRVGSHIELRQGPVHGKFRMFGVYLNSSLLENERLQMAVSAEEVAHEVIVRSKMDGSEVQRMPYRYMSSGWVAVTFSDDGSTIGVVEPVTVTFYRYRSKQPPSQAA